MKSRRSSFAMLVPNESDNSPETEFLNNLYKGCYDTIRSIDKLAKLGENYLQRLQFFFGKNIHGEIKLQNNLVTTTRELANQLFDSMLFVPLYQRSYRLLFNNVEKLKDCYMQKKTLQTAIPFTLFSGRDPFHFDLATVQTYSSEQKENTPRCTPEEEDFSLFSYNSPMTRSRHR